MNRLEPTAWTRPEPSAPRHAKPQGGPRPRDGSATAASILLGQGTDPRRDSRRIAAGLFFLAILCVVFVNVAIYQGAESRLKREGWDKLTATTDGKRDQIRDMLEQFGRQSRLVAEHASVRSWGAAALGGRLGPGEYQALEAELQRAVETAHFDHVLVIDPAGKVFAAAHQSPYVTVGEDFALAKRAAEAGRLVLGDVENGQGSDLEIMAAVPLASGAEGHAAVAVFRSGATDALIPILSRWPGFGPSARAYLVRRDGEQVVVMTPAREASGPRRVERLPIAARGSLAAWMAATGLESRVEAGANGPEWAVTRFLPEVNWGLVGEVRREEMMAGMRGTLAMLLLLDLAMAACALACWWVLRRQYMSGLAQREREVTERHASRVQAIFDTAFDAILTFDRNGRVRTVNRAAEELLGRPAAELDGQPLQRFLHWGDGGPGSAQALPAPGTVIVSEGLRGDGSVVPVEFSLGRAGEGDDLLYTAIVRDIQERVEAETRIRAFAEGLEVSNRRLEEVNAQLEEASRLKSEFLANTSHELRTPLNGMIGFLQLVLDGMCESPEEEKDFLKQALQCSRHLLGLINDVLDIAKIEAGKLSLEIERVDVQGLFDEVYTVTHVQAQQRGVALSFEVAEGAGVSVRGDFGKVKQVLINLVGNALKFTPRGSIRVRASARADLGHCMFEVVDTGIGIPQDRQGLIFEKFTQGDGSTTRKYGGTGLGLAISRSLIELMGGIIGVQSEGEGKGTRMYFSLPVWREGELAPPDLAEDHDPERIEGPSGGPVVMVVEDDPIFRQFVTAVLHQSGYRTLQAPHAEAAWVLARRLRPAVVVLDFALSCSEGANLRTGWDLAERMTTDPKTRHIPVVFVTGFEKEVRDKLKATAFARRPEHLVKPIEASALIERIGKVVGEIKGRSVRILMADDDPAVSAYVRKVLPEDRFYVEVANDGEECLHILRTQPKGFDVLLLDLMMPDVSGYDVLREMTLSGTNADLPVLVLTNFPEPRNEEERRLLDEGLVLDVLPKTAVHDNPQLLPHVIDWHLQVQHEGGRPAPEREAA